MMGKSTKKKRNPQISVQDFTNYSSYFVRAISNKSPKFANGMINKFCRYHQHPSPI